MAKPINREPAAPGTGDLRTVVYVSSACRLLCAGAHQMAGSARLPRPGEMLCRFFVDKLVRNGGNDD